MYTLCAEDAAGAAMARIAVDMGVSQGVGLILIREKSAGGKPVLWESRIFVIGNPFLAAGESEGSPEVNLLTEAFRTISEMVEAGDPGNGAGTFAIVDEDEGQMLYVAFASNLTISENRAIAERGADAVAKMLELAELQDELEEMIAPPQKRTLFE